MLHVRQHSTDLSIALPFPRWNYVAFALLAFTLHLTLATQFYNLHVFQQYDILFNADPNEGLVNLSHGWGKSEIKHLTLTYLFSPFARTFGAVVSGLSLSSTPTPILRERFTLCLLAFLSAVRAVVFLEVARFLGLGHKAALWLNAIAFFAFSNMLFGAIPDSFALSSTALVTGYYLALKPGPVLAFGNSMNSGRFTGEAAAWGVLFVVGVGITITNAISLSLLFLLALYRRTDLRLMRMLTTVALAATLAVGLNVGIAEVAKRLLNSQTAELSYTPTTDKYVHEPSWSVVGSLLRAFGNGIGAGAPGVVPLSLSPHKTVWYNTALTYETNNALKFSDVARSSGVLLVAVLGVAGYWRKKALWPVLAISVAIIASNIAIHLFFGDESVLYSLHWHYSLVVLMAGVVFPERILPRRVTQVACLTLLLVLATANPYRIHTIIESLEEMKLPAPLVTH